MAARLHPESTGVGRFNILTSFVSFVTLGPGGYWARSLVYRACALRAISMRYAGVHQTASFGAPAGGGDLGTVARRCAHIAERIGIGWVARHLLQARSPNSWTGF